MMGICGKEIGESEVHRILAHILQRYIIIIIMLFIRIKKGN